MTPEQEQVYFTWKRIGWCSLNERTLAVVVLRDREDEKKFCLWVQERYGEPTLKFFIDPDDIRDDLEQLGVFTAYPDFRLPW